MPGVTLHLLLADRTLSALQRPGVSSPFPTSHPAMRNAFRQGALGPDLGYFPGGHRLLSDLAHHVSTGDLTRTLVRTARTPTERAFAWGWLTHVIADQRLHPHIGLSVGALRTGDSPRFVGGDEDQSGHVQVETGIDAAISVAHPDIRRVPLQPVFDRMSINFLRRGYEQTYRGAPSARLFLASHAATTRLARGALILAHVMGRELASPERVPVMRILRSLLGRTLRPRSAGGVSTALSYLSPLWPDRLLMDRVSDEVQSFPERFLALVDSDLEGLENRDLDTGELESATPTPAAKELPDPDHVAWGSGAQRAEIAG